MKSTQRGFGPINTNHIKEQPKRQKSKKIPKSQLAKEKKALALIKRNEFSQAELIYRELEEEGSESHTVYRELGTLLKIKGDSKKAIAYLNIAIGLEPNDPDTHNNLGFA